MKVIGPLARAALVAGLALTGTTVVSPASAGPAEAALLASYVGSWSGRGRLTGSRSETVVCRLTLNPGNADKVNYSGRCAMAGTTISVNGTLAYIDASRRYEAAMTTNAGFTGLAIGQRNGDNIVFNLREVGADEEGRSVTVTSAIALNPARITVDFKVVFNDSGDTITASVPFTQ
jgi:hypothetical protein